MMDDANLLRPIQGFQPSGTMNDRQSMAHLPIELATDAKPVAILLTIALEKCPQRMVSGAFSRAYAMA